MSPCTYTVTPDQHFLLGQRKDLPRITLLGGFSGHGFKFAPLIGEIAANLVLEGGTAFPIDMFDPQRFDSA
jgi:sarcosine oxidase